MSKAKPITKQEVEIKNFVARRDAMLEKRSVEALIEFIKTDPCYDGDDIREKFLSADPAAQELTLYQMIEECTKVSKATKEWAAKKHQEWRLRHEQA